MNKLCFNTAIVLVIINFAALFYLNYSSELNLTSQFFVLPWLAIQSIFVLSVTSTRHGEQEQ